LRVFCRSYSTPRSHHGEAELLDEGFSIKDSLIKDSLIKDSLIKDSDGGRMDSPVAITSRRAL
jgi:hypothetical protein